MAIVEVKVPQLSESVAEATLLQWKKKVGDQVLVDEILIEVETDKVVLEVPAPSAGVIVELVAGDGATVAAEQLIARIDTEGKAGAVAAPAAAPAAAVAAAPAAAPAATGGSKGDVAMPAAAKLLADNNLSVGAVAGTGKDGRVTKGDVLGAVAAGASAPKTVAAVAIPTGAPTKSLPQVAAPSVHLGDRPEQRVPMSRLRARVAERLLQSQSTNAILTTFNEINMAPVMEMRKRMQERFEKEHGVKLGFMSFFVKAAVHALKKFPVLNASVDGNDIVYHGYFDIGIAVGSPRGLVVPILRNADQMSFADIEKKIAEFGVKARDGKLGPADMSGACFTISSLGGIGGRYFTPIINAPEVAILGVCKSTHEPVWNGSAFVPRLMLPLSLSWDHRVIDGASAARFNVYLGQILADFRRVLL